MLVEAITTKYDECAGRAGRDQLTRMLRADGIAVSESTVGAIMRETRLRAVRVRAWKTTTVQDPQARTAHIVNHMLDADGNRDFSASVPGTRLCGDITYLKTGEGWLYLATVIDLCTGMIIGFLPVSPFSHPADRPIVVLSLKVLQPPIESAQYTSVQFQQWCAANNVTQSMGAVGVCWDNSVAENFFSHLKTEFYHHHSFATRLAARTAVMDYIESWYNRARPNARAGHLTPVQALGEHRDSDTADLAA
ncbi:IS3 family transposase [Brevibacterium sandarakinum]|nr:IS3 family transposase [Brevibacterium sandarakinum]